MSQDITKKDETLPSEERDFFPSFGTFAEEVSTEHIVGRLLTFKKGDWVVGNKGGKNAELPEGTRLVAVMDSLTVGWIKWSESRPIEHAMGEVIKGYKIPPRSTMGDTDEAQWETDNDDKPRNPWQYATYLIMIDESTDELYTFATSGSNGGIKCVQNLGKQYEPQLDGDKFPIVALAGDSYKHSNRAWGTIQVPVLKVVGWAPKAAALTRLGKGNSGASVEAKPARKKIVAPVKKVVAPAPAKKATAPAPAKKSEGGKSPCF